MYFRGHALCCRCQITITLIFTGAMPVCFVAKPIELFHSITDFNASLIFTWIFSIIVYLTGHVEIMKFTVCQSILTAKLYPRGSPHILLWRHNGCDGVSNHQPHDCLLNRLFRPRSKKTSNLRITGLCAGNSPVIDEFPTQMASNVEMFSFDGVIMKQNWSFIYQQWTIYARTFLMLLVFSMAKRLAQHSIQMRNTRYSSKRLSDNIKIA